MSNERLNYYDFYGSGLKHNREKMGKTQQELADEVGMARAQLSRYENGTIPGIDTAIKLYNATHKNALAYDASDLYGEELRKRREKAGITQQQLSNITGIDQSLISRYEGGTPPNIKNAANIQYICEYIREQKDYNCAVDVDSLKLR